MSPADRVLLAKFRGVLIPKCDPREVVRVCEEKSAAGTMTESDRRGLDLARSIVELDSKRECVMTTANGMVTASASLARLKRARRELDDAGREFLVACSVMTPGEREDWCDAHGGKSPDDIAYMEIIVRRATGQKGRARRILILKLLQEAGRLTAPEIGRRLSLRRHATIGTLRALRRAGCVEANTEGWVSTGAPYSAPAKTETPKQREMADRRARILALLKQDGGRLTIDEIGRRVGLSRSHVASALRAMVAAGIVENKPYHIGYWSAGVDPELDTAVSATHGGHTGTR